MHVAVRTMIVAGVTLAGACSLTTDLDGFTGGASPPASPPDAAVLTDTGPGSEAAAEASRVDSGSFCSTVPANITFCADFDDGAIPGPWSAVLTGSGGMVQIDKDSRSPPNAVSFITNGSTSSSSLRYDLPANLRTVIVELDLRLAASGGSDFDVLVIEAGAPEVGFEINTGREIYWDEDIIAGDSITNPTGVTLGSEWTHLRLELRVEGTALNGVLSVDGQERARHTFETKVFTNGDAPHLNLGDDSFTNGTTNPWRVLVDNFTIDAR